MKINFDTQSVTLSAGELSQLFISTSRGERSKQKSAWRSKVGQEWHVRFAKEKAKSSEIQSEVSLKKTISHRGWSIQIDGRIDLIEKLLAQTILWEVKTVSRPLPISAEDLYFLYPHYFNQLSIYHFLYQQEHPSEQSKAQLAFISISNEEIQTIAVDPREVDERARHLIDQLVGYLQSRRDKQSSRRNLSFQPAFTSPREGQEFAKKQLIFRASKEKFICFEAPTGFGKTGVSLEAALALLRDSKFSRIIYLTGKNSGQQEVINQLDKMILPQERDGLFYYQMQNQANHYRPEPSLPELPAEVTIALRQDSVSFSDVQHLAQQYQVDGYFLSQLRLNYCDIWVGDYNYVFSPKAKNVFFDRADFSAEETLLIIDEAHNLPERVRSALSSRICFEEVRDLRNQIDFFANRWIQLLEEWLNSLEELTERSPLSDQDFIRWQDLTWETLELAKEKHPPIEEFSDFQKEAWWNLLSFSEAVQSEEEGYFLWIPRPHALEYACLDASSDIKKTIQSFKHSIAMSATLQPHQDFFAQLGFAGHAEAPLEVPAFWRENAYSVAVDTRINTSLRTRERHYATTAQTIYDLASTCTSPLVVFFSSFAYASAIATYLESAFGHLSLAQQESGWTSDEQLQFLEECLLTSQVIFLVMGGSLAEGIDLLGGKVSTAMVVGPPLAEQNALHEEIASYTNIHAEKNFSNTYAVPAMRRLHQALGRLVRAPGQSARILLHDQRFGQSPYKELLLPEYQPSLSIQSDAQFANWLYEQPNDRAPNV